MGRTKTYSVVPGPLKEFGSTIRYLREERGLTQLELAGAVGVRQPYIGALERGEKSGTEDTRRAVSKALGWPYQAVLDLAEKIRQGEDPAQAAKMVFAIHDKALPPPVLAEDLRGLRGYRIHMKGLETDRKVWVDSRTLAGRKPGKVKAHLIGDPPGTLVLVDHADQEWKAGALYLCRPTPAGEGLMDRPTPAGGPILRRARMFSGAILLTGMGDEAEAVPGPWSEIVLGRALWYQVNLELA